ncbi:MAG: D-lyxose/D-mannose family sugar isomerase, partial [Verrucomicrobiota bacterium]
MKRSEINALVTSASSFFKAGGWTLPPEPRWDVTDFGLGDWRKHGLVLVNLAEHAEYCEKLMYARKGMTTPAHCHKKKKEDIISRRGTLQIRVWPGRPGDPLPESFELLINNRARRIRSGDCVVLE